jgi:hypothetical protein
MKQMVAFRFDGSLLRSFRATARFQHQSLTAFVVQAGIAAVESARKRGLGIKAPAEPRDGRRKQADK